MAVCDECEKEIFGINSLCPFCGCCGYCCNCPKMEPDDDETCFDRPEES